MRLVVTAPVVVAHLTDGAWHHVYDGEPVPERIDPGHAAYLLMERMVADLDEMPSIDDDVRAELAGR